MRHRSASVWQTHPTVREYYTAGTLAGRTESLMVAGADGPGQSEIDYPSVPLAYELIPASYEMIAQRIEAVDQRVQSLQTFAVTLTVAVLVIFSPSGADLGFATPWFPAAMAAFGSLIIVGLFARAAWQVTVVSPKELYEGWLDLPVNEFRVRSIYWAGEHFEQNVSVVLKKSRLANVMTALFLFEAGFLLIWVVAGA